MKQKLITLEEFKKHPTVRYQPWVFEGSFNIMWEYEYESGQHFNISYNSYYRRLYIYHTNGNVIIDEDKFIEYLTEEYTVKIDNIFYW